MQHPEHLISNNRKGLTPERIAGLVFGGLVPAVFIWALIAGLIPKFSIPFEPPIIARIIHDKSQPPPDHPPANPTLQGPQISMPAAPYWDTTDDTHYIGPQVFGGGGNQAVGFPDQSARSIGSTHTTPPYPSIEARLGHAGMVTLRLSVAADGSVVDATVENSSGSSALDQAAIEWVKSHWRYTPATHNGTAVSSTTEAAIRFDLKNAMR